MKDDLVSGRRLAAFALLVLASVGCIGLVEADLDPTWDYNTSYLVWNLGLAWLPFLFALAFYDGYRRGLGTGYLAPLGLLWLLFFPNAPYILTDFVHLRDWGVTRFWVDAMVIAGFAGTGLLLGLGSLVLVHTVVSAARGPIAGWGTSVVALGLASVGIYLGRFHELNSWDAIVDPGSVLAPFVAQLRDGPLHPHFLGVTVAFTSFLVVAYLVVYAVAQPGLALDPRRPPRR
jgi:uncharacterized membrane protein